MYLETGLGQPSKRQRKGPFISQPRVVPTDRLMSAQTAWRWNLNVPFRKDFGAFRQEVGKRIGLHVIKGRGEQVDRTNNKHNEQRLKALHDELLKRDSPVKEGDIVSVSARFAFIQGPERHFSWVEILSE